MDQNLQYHINMSPTLDITQSHINPHNNYSIVFPAN